MKNITLFLIVCTALLLATCKSTEVTVVPSLEINPTSKNVDETSSNFTIDITSTISWTANSIDNWLTVSPTSGEGNKSIKVEYQANTGSERTGTITLKGAGVPDKTLKVIQKGITLIKPVATTQNATGTSQTGTILNAIVNANDLSTTIGFEYGETTSYGQTVSASPSPILGNTNTNVSANITGLAPGKTYHFRIVATNIAGTTQGVDLNFKTLNTPSIISHTFSAGVDGCGVSAIVNANGLITTITFEFGNPPTSITAVQGNPNQISGYLDTEITSGWYIYTPPYGTNCRIKAVNSSGTTYSEVFYVNKPGLKK